MKEPHHPSSTASEQSSPLPESGFSYYDESQYLYITTTYDNADNLTQVAFKNCVVPRLLLKILGLIVPFHSHICKISFDRSAIASSIHEVRSFQPLLLNLTQFNIDSCVFPEANFDILLDYPTCINHLSLTRCELNDVVVKSIFDKLTTGQAANFVTTINLSSNRITDQGAIYIAQCLRINRRLRYINLSMNMLTDYGAKHILDTLKKFPATREDFLRKREAHFEFLLKYNPFNDSCENDDNKSTVMSRRSTKASIEKQPFKTDSTGDNVFQHAFCKSNTEVKDGVSYCLGNNHLCALNLSNNHLKFVTLVRIVEVLKYQVNAQRKPRGLVYVNIDGNYITHCPKTIELMKLLEVQTKTSMSDKKVYRTSLIQIGKPKKTSLTASITSSPANRNRSLR